MLASIEFIAVLATTIFTGAAIYINLVAHPARMGCTTEIAATVWAPSFHASRKESIARGMIHNGVATSAELRSVV
jgi:hypothetical protein